MLVVVIGCIRPFIIFKTLVCKLRNGWCGEVHTKLRLSCNKQTCQVTDLLHQAMLHTGT